MNRQLRLTLLTEIPAPYRIPIFNALAVRDDIELEVLYLAKQHPARPYHLHEEEIMFSWRILHGVHVTRGNRWLVVNAGVIGAVRRSRPDVLVLGGWNQPAFWQALAFAKAAGRTPIAWVESTLRDERSNSGPLESAKRMFLRASAGCLVPGRAAVDYVAALGVPRSRIGVAPNAVDLEVFGARAAGLRRERAELRTRLGISGRCIFSAGRLDPEKGIDDAICALSGLPHDVELVIAGVGREEERLRTLAVHIAPGRVRFLGFLPRDEIVPWLVAADAFVLPSRSEQWGMGINEAVAAGVPVVASDAAGAAYELIEEGANGAVVVASDADALTRALEQVLGEPSFAQTAAARAAELTAEHAPESWAAAVSELAHATVAVR